MNGSDEKPLDLFVVGGGINGAGIACDAVGRSLKVGLCEMNDFASATSSASTKLIHGGLRYLEQYEFRLVREALQEPVRKVIGAIKSVLERTPPELASDLVDSGITLCGGGALLRGLPELISRETELDVRVADRPLEAVARGTGIFLENLELYSQFLEGGEDLA